VSQLEDRTIIVRGAREHNLRNIDLELPHNALIVFTGVSGSGKSSLAFDTLYAEGQRRYIESLSSYARQFLGQLPKPDVDYLGGLSPTISIQQKTASRNPRSTVGTVTEVYDFLRVLYARVGTGHCVECGRPITAQAREQILQRILSLPEGTRLTILAPVVRGQKGEFRELFAEMLKRGYVRARVDGQLVRLTDDLKLDRRIKHHIEIVIDRLKCEPRQRSRLAEAIEAALKLGEETLIVEVESAAQPAAESVAQPPAALGTESAKTATPTTRDLLFSSRYACTACNLSYEPPTPQLFSFNAPQGMCPECDGLGTLHTFAPDLLVPDDTRSFADGAVVLVGSLREMGRWKRHIYEGVARTLGIDLKTPWRDLPAQHRDWLLYGSGQRHITYEWKQRGGGVWKHGGTWEGIIPQLLAQFKKTAAGPRRMQLEKYMRSMRCPSCHGQRLHPQARAVRLNGRTLPEIASLPIATLAEWVQRLPEALSEVQRRIASELLKEIAARLGFLLNVGLDYLTLDRPTPSLSGGEAQRIRLAGQIGSGLVGVLYILDEPSIGLHPRDNQRLLQSLLRLRDLGNTVLVVEHDEDTMRAADYIVDFGPGPGVRGGQVVAAGTYRDIVSNPNSLTGQYLSGAKRIPVPATRRPVDRSRCLRIVNARHNNLRGVTVEIPLGVVVCVTGVSGSGKSSLVNDVLRNAVLARQRTANGTSKSQGNGNDIGSGNANGTGTGTGTGTSTSNGSGDGDGYELPEDDLDTARLVGAHDRIDGLEHIDKLIDIDQSPIGRTPRSNPATYIKVFDQIRELYAQLTDSKLRGYTPSRFSFNRVGGRCEACEGNGATRLEMDFLADIWVTCPVCEGKRFNRETLQVRYRGKSIHDVLEMDVQEALVHFENVPKIREMLQTLHDVGLDYLKLGQPSPTLSGGEAQRIKLARELCRRATGRTLYILDEPTTGLHFEDIRKLLEVLHQFADAGNTVLIIEHNLDVIKTADWLIDLGPEGGSGGGQVVVTGTPETVAACAASHTGQALRAVLGAAAAQSPGPLVPAVGLRSAQKRRASASRQLSHIEIEGACEHNLKSVNARLPRGAMTVFCGPSGSGKSSLALDTLYAEGQRRYVESLSSYARQFLGQVQKPRVERISGLSPAIAIEQKTTARSPRSTVGTITEIHDYLRVLFARLGQMHCPRCDVPVGTMTTDEIIAQVLAQPEGTKLYILAPLERRGQERYDSLWEEIRRAGYVRMRVDGVSYGVDEPPAIDHKRKHRVEVVIDRLVVRGSLRTRLAEAVEQALAMGRGVMHLAYVQDDRPEPQWRVERFSQHLSCGSCGRSFEPLNPHHFSFNSPLGWCPTCEGLGTQHGANPALLIRDPNLSVRAGAVALWPALEPGSPWLPFAQAIAQYAHFSLDTPFAALTTAQQQAIVRGTGEAWLDPGVPGLPLFQYKGLLPALDEASRISHVYRARLDSLVSEVPCSSCHGSRLRDDAAAVRFAGRTLAQIAAMPLADALRWFRSLQLSAQQQQIAGEVLREIHNRLQFLVDVGLDYLTLDRPSPTLSGGEAQRIRLASQIGSGLTGVLYVLDEPTIGLHPRDNARLLRALQHLRDLGNTLVLVEHDREVIAAADYLLDFGPGAGDLGGEIVAAGTPKQLRRAKSLTGQYLSGRAAIPVPTNRRAPIPGAVLRVVGARHHNLKNVTVEFPLGCLVAVTGVSGSGKSSLVNEVLVQTLARKLHRARTPALAHDAIEGIELIDKMINVDQDPIGNTPSSNPATYTGVFDLIRQLYAQLPEAKVRGYTAQRFSFNKPGGRCEACEGNGQKKIEMHFLPDVWVECEVCKGKRYNAETLAVQYKGHTIADVLDLRISDALQLFINIPKIRQILQTLVDVGLGYLTLGQAAPTLSGGESQRVKLAAELARPSTGRTLYVLDEPTTGLHFDDVRKLLDVLHRLVDLGNTVIVVEHNLDVIKSADWVVDLGPEAGARGGQVVAVGTPEAIVAGAEQTGSHTAHALAAVLAAGPHAPRPRHDPTAALAAREGDLDLAEVGKDAKMPWEIDGPRWHTQDRLTSAGKPCRWEGSALLLVLDELAKLGTFSEPNWNHRSTVEVTAKTKSQGWFLHAHTNLEWYLRLVFRVGRNTFKQKALVERLGIAPFNQLEGIEKYGDEDRVRVTNRPGPWQDVTIQVVRRSEIDTPAFREFLREAAAAFHAVLKKQQTKPEDVMPWKINGQRWHLGEKGFPPGRKPRWDRALLPKLLDWLRELDPTLELKWDNQHFVSVRLPELNRTWGYLRTKEPDALHCRFLSAPGQLNLARVESFGENPEVVESTDGSMALVLHLVSENHVHPAQLKLILTELLRGFRQRYAHSAEPEPTAAD
jgi:excinuclease ABC subunit A